LDPIDKTVFADFQEKKKMQLPNSVAKDGLEVMRVLKI
jgi:hypothetical protein